MNLEERIAALEKSSSRWRWIAVVTAASALLCVGALAAFSSRGVIRAEGLVLVDSAGDEVVRLGPLLGGDYGLSVRSSRSGTSILLGSVGEDAGLSVLVDGEARAMVTSGGLSIASKGRRGRLVAGFEVGQGNWPTLVLTDENGRARSLVFPGRLELRGVDGTLLFRAPEVRGDK